MTKPAKPSMKAVRRAARKPSINAGVNRQTRKLLAQHYRAKHGVK